MTPDELATELETVLECRAREERRAIAAAGVNHLASAIERLAAARRANAAAIREEAAAINQLRRERRAAHTDLVAPPDPARDAAAPGVTTGTSETVPERKPPAKENGFRRVLPKRSPAGLHPPAARTRSANSKA